MRFIGQHHIMKQLRFLLPDLYKNNTSGANFLLRGPSGYGKTTMAIAMAHYLAGSHFEYYLADWTKFRFIKRVIFIDEIHRIGNFENLYPIMDEKSHVFIFATNQDGELPEAFSNRCYEFVFSDYSDEELSLIAKESARFSTTDESLLQIVEAGNRNPRVIKSLVDRLSIYFSENNAVDPMTINFAELIANVFDINAGLDTLSRRYLEVLNDVGGKASISLLKNILHVDERTLKEQVEPVLLRKNLIRITAKGRSRNYDNGIS